MRYLLILLLLFGCAGRTHKNATKSGVSTEVRSLDIKLLSAARESYSQGDEIVVGYETEEKFDSVKLVVSDTSVAVRSAGNEWYIKSSKGSKVGDIAYRFDFFSGGRKYSRSASYRLLPSEPAVLYRAFVREALPMKSYFLQGLEIANDTLFVSSGVEGRSFVESLSFPSMKMLRAGEVNSKYFGEGLTVLGDKVYVLTWMSKKCVIYDRRTLARVKEVDYPYTEGWGLTNDGRWLYMSDGSENIHRIDPETFAEVDRIKVASDRGILQNVNELEWIGGEIWANVFTFDYLLRIDPATGAVKGIVYCDDVVSRITRETHEDFLNGIAYDKRSKGIWVTGKNYKKLFRITVEKE